MTPCRRFGVATVMLLVTFAGVRASESTEHFRILGKFSSGVAYIAFAPYASEGVLAQNIFDGPANNMNTWDAATWTRLGARSNSEPGLVEEHVGIRVVDDDVDECTTAFLQLRRHRTSGVGPPGTFCNTFSTTFWKSTSWSLDTCAGSLSDKLFFSKSLVLNFAGEGGTGLKGYMSTIIASHWNEAGEETSRSQTGCYVIRWDPPL